MFTGRLDKPCLREPWVIKHWNKSLEMPPKSDVYSVGVVAVELLTGRKAHTLLEGAVLRWETACADLPLPVQEWLDRMLHQDIHQRFSAAEGLEALTDIADVFVEGGSISTAEVDTSEASLRFLELLEDAIDDETEGKRAERVRQHQEKLERERAEAQSS